MLPNSMKLKQLNIDHVKSVLRTQAYSTKASIATATGLSVATCGNILKDLLLTGEVFEIELEASTGGRPSRRFKYNKDFANVAIIYARKESTFSSLSCVVSNLVGNYVYEEHIECDYLTLKKIDDAINNLLSKYPNIKVLSLGVPGVVRQGVIGICDFIELSNLNIVEYLTKKYNIIVTAENDVNSTALGYYIKSLSKADENLTYIYYPMEGNSGAGIIIDGNILRGQTNFAGEVSFLPLGIDPENQGELQKNLDLFSEYVTKIIRSINCIINPKKIVLSGYCFTDQLIESIKTLLYTLTPDIHIPELIYEEDIHDSYVYGLTTMALDKLSCNIKIIDK